MDEVSRLGISVVSARSCARHASDRLRLFFGWTGLDESDGTGQGGMEEGGLNCWCCSRGKLGRLSAHWNPGNDPDVSSAVTVEQQVGEQSLSFLPLYILTKAGSPRLYHSEPPRLWLKWSGHEEKRKNILGARWAKTLKNTVWQSINSHRKNREFTSSAGALACFSAITIFKSCDVQVKTVHDIVYVWMEEVLWYLTSGSFCSFGSVLW